MGRKRTAPREEDATKKSTDPKLAFVEQGLIQLGQSFTQAAKKFADENGATVFVHISLIPALKERDHGSK
jgi:hypothetical protein